MNRFVSKIMGKPGDSGGIIISPYGELIGIERGGDGNSYTSCIKIKKALDLIEFYKNQNS
jgi:hypothetical protein